MDTVINAAVVDINSKSSAIVTEQGFSLKQAKEYIYSADLQPVFNRLVNVDGWKKQEAEEAIQQYRNYLYLRRKYPEHNLPPSKDIDEAWHAHVLHTKDYREFCKKVFFDQEEQYLDHEPHITKEGSMNQLSKLFEDTQRFYHEEFGSYIYQIRDRSLFRKLMDQVRVVLVKQFPGFEKQLED